MAIAYCLHTRPYRETSIIADIFTLEEGRLSVIAKGVKGKSGNRKNGSFLQPFIRMEIQYSGKSDLKTLTHIEPMGNSSQPTGERLFAGMYVNELLVRLLAEHYEYPEIFSLYGGLLTDLSGDKPLNDVLRNFEFNFLKNLGYEVPFIVVDDEGGGKAEEISDDCFYEYLPEQGFRIHPSNSGTLSEKVRKGLVFDGAVLNRISRGDYSGEVSISAKLLMRRSLEPLLGGRPLNSRLLFT